MTFGLTDDGFLIKRLPDILDEIVSDLKAQFGNIDSSADSVFGQLIGVLAKREADVWEAFESLYFSRYPDTATGAALDYAAGLTGISRLPATYSTGLVALIGDEGTVVPEGTQFSSLENKDVFSLDSDTEISAVDVTDIFINVEQAADDAGVIFSVDINEEECGLTSGAAMTVEEVSAAISANITSTFGTLITITDYLNGALRLRSPTLPLTVIVTDDLLSWGTPGEITAGEIGSVSAAAKDIVNIDTPVSGLDSVVNYDEIDAGRNLESDTALRQRRLIELTIAGAGTVESIRSKILQNVADVTACAVFENDTDTTVGIMTPHSLQAVVSGGDEQEIADMIWQVKPAGIATIGSVSKTVLDSQGLGHTIKFNRAYERIAWVYAIITPFTAGEEEVFPDDGVAQVAEKLLAYGESLDMGKDIIPQRFYKPINEVTGIDYTDLWVAVPEYTAAIVDETYADLEALFAYLTTLRAPYYGDLIAVLGAGDTTDDALATAKGGAVVANDVFAVSELSPLAAVTYVGNLGIDPTTVLPSETPFSQTNIEIGDTEQPVFNSGRITVRLV